MSEVPGNGGNIAPVEHRFQPGQSGNPASRHYADGIDAWRKAQYMSFPFQSQNLDSVYGTRRLMLTPAK